VIIEDATCGGLRAAQQRTNGTKSMHVQPTDHSARPDGLHGAAADGPVDTHGDGRGADRAGAVGTTAVPATPGESDRNDIAEQGVARRCSS
jgi:hypothetical protein